MRRIVVATAAAVLSAALAHAQEVKVGIVLTYTGTLGEPGQYIDRGAALYLKLNADKVKPG